MAYTLTVLQHYACCAKDNKFNVICKIGQGVATHFLSICMCSFPLLYDLFADRPQCSPLCRGFHANADGGKTKDEEQLGSRENTALVSHFLVIFMKMRHVWNAFSRWFLGVKHHHPCSVITDCKTLEFSFFVYANRNNLSSLIGMCKSKLPINYMIIEIWQCGF